MKPEPPHIISIWLVDPVGGTFVDWPSDDNLDAGTFTPDLWDDLVWRSPTVAEWPLHVLSQLGDESLPFLWCEHGSLERLLDDCQTARKRSAELPVAVDEFTPYIDRLDAAIKFAMPIAEAGICIT